jgi:hypothetical protein
MMNEPAVARPLCSQINPAATMSAPINSGSQLNPKDDVMAE